VAKFSFLFSVLTPLSFVHTNPDQSRNSTYISEAYKLIQKRVDKAILKKKHQLKYALVAVFDVTLTAFHSKAKALDDLGIIQGDKLENLTMAFQKCLVEQLGGLVVHEPKLLDESNTLERFQRSMYLLILSIIDALSALGVDSKLLAEIAENLKAFSATVVETELNVGQRLRVFMAKHGPKAIEEDTEISLTGDVSDFYRRQLIIERARAGAVGLNNKQKLEYLNDIFGTSLSRLDNLDRLLCARTTIEMIDGMCSLLPGSISVLIQLDVGQSSEEKGTKDTEEFDLTEAYSILCGQLWKFSGVRQFCIIAETLQLMLRTKVSPCQVFSNCRLTFYQPRSISQFNVDMTLGAISIICSRNGPRLNELRPGTIYSHMCWLVQAVLAHHRTKLQGHFHLVVQVMQSLLRCLFTSLSHSSTKTDKAFGAPPPWLASRKNGLKARHAAAYTRLVLMICDPTVSAVRGAQQNNLTSAKDKAKRMAGIHMQYVLISYIKLQLEMKMLPEIREKMVPGLYAIFDTTTPEIRRMVSDSLDSSGRAVFGTLYKDWQRFGKWGGS
jgi:nucleolar pre-ribosomal-associated protein 2